MKKQNDKVVSKKNKFTPFTNWIYLCIIILVIGLLCWYFATWKKVKDLEKYLNSYLVTTNTVTLEINDSDELNQIMQELPSNYFIYISYTGDADVFNLEKKLKNVIDNYGIQDSFYFVNVTNNLEDENLLQDLNDSLNTTKIDAIPCILYYNNGILTEVISNTKGMFNVKEFTSLLSKYDYEKKSQ